MSLPYTDGTDWYRLPDGVLLLPGPLTLVCLDGEMVSVHPMAVTGYRVTPAVAMAMLLEAAAPVVAELQDGLVALLAGDGALADGVVAAARAARQPQSEAFAALTERAGRIGAGIGGASGAAIVDFPRRLSESLVRQTLGRSDGTALGGFEDAARDLLAGLIAQGPRAAMRQCADRLAPRPSDLDAVFTAPLAGRMAAHYADLYARPLAPTPGSGGQTRFVAATVADLRDGTDRGLAFPRQYARLTPHLRDGPVWVRWWWQGTAWDGLVRLPDRWIWLPKPWRAL